MRTVIFFFFIAILAVSCQMKQNESPDNSANDTGDDVTTDVTDTIKSTAIFWIDKAELKNCKDYGFRTIKAKVFLHEDGKVDLLAFVKKQSSGSETYIRHHLSKFQVSEKMLKGNYVPLGEQYVQLRCMWEKLKGK